MTFHYMAVLNPTPLTSEGLTIGSFMRFHPDLDS